MSQDIEQYANIIEQLKPMIHEPEFNQVLNQVASAIPKEKRFLIKMELMRLARPCTRLIDLRGLVSGKCRSFEHHNKLHYLDDIAIETFERQVRIFGEYTIGVYEAVTNTENNYRVMHKKDQEQAKNEKNSPPKETDTSKTYRAPLLKFGNFAQRGEERMNFSVSIEMFTSQNKSVQATTIDISVNGLKVKTSKEHLLKEGERLSIQFRGLEKEYSLDKRQGIAYVIKNVESAQHDQRINLIRQLDIPNPVFDKFFEHFIHGNKRRYKVNLDNTFTAIQNKTYEQYYIPNFASIPVFIDCVDGEYTPRYALANDCNREEIQYWANEIQDLKIGYLLTEDRIKHALSLNKGQQELFIYVFNHINDGKIYFYSATHHELDKRPALKNLFLGFGARKVSWRIYKLQLTDMVPTQSYRPLSISNSINDNVKKQNQKPSPRLMSRLKNLSYIAVLTNVTDDISTEHYQKHPVKREQLAKLKIFGHPRNKPPAVVTVYRFKYFNQRRETRFLLRTSVKVKIENNVFEGNTEDFSTLGLRVELNAPLSISKETQISLTFPQLQKVTNKFTLSDLPYVIRNVSKDRYVLHLQNVVTDENKTAKRFFEALIKSNRSKLKSFRDEEEVPGIGEALRNIYTENIVNTAFFLSKDATNYIADAAATGVTKNRIYNLLTFQTELDMVNLYPIFRSNKSQHEFITHTMKTKRPSDKPDMRELFVAFDPSQETTKDAIESAFSEQFTSTEHRREFIAQALQRGQFIAIKVFLGPTGRPDFETMQAELQYVGIYALHKAKALEDQLWNVSGIGDLVDVTDEVLRRFEFTESVILINHKTPPTHKIKQVGIEQLLKT
ncbi:PilZ domain-containing protein [Paraglaciecola marina]|uniref:PilZ domain-containing protein n=1 Tax=Paraglaciecola marina TaxID=2500157 RepID=UPI00105DA1F5|nr:PilZ domain-containing protein [Paraglaciecola marina]